MGVFDIMDAMGKMGEMIEANKHIFEQIPAMLEKWTEFQNSIFENTKIIRETTDRIDTRTKAILAAVDPGQMPEEMAREVIANSVNDPRNIIGPDCITGQNPTDDAFVENARKLAAVTENGGGYGNQ